MTEKERILSYADQLKQERKKKDNKSYSLVKIKQVPDLDDKFNEFCREEKDFLKNYYTPGYNMSVYVQKILDGKT